MALNFDKLKSVSSLASMIDKPMEASTGGLLDLPLGQIAPDPNQPRKTFDAQSLSELAQSIEAQGLIEPIVVRRDPAGAGYLIVSGERRWRASKLAGRDTIQAILRDSEEEVSEVQLIENIQREDLTAHEIYMALTALIDSGKTQVELCKKLGKSKGWVSGYASVAKMPTSFQDALRDGRANDINALVQLHKVHKSAPELAEKLANSGAPITRHAVAKLSEKLQDQVTGTNDSEASTTETSTKADKSPSSPSPSHSNSSTEGDDSVGQDSLESVRESKTEPAITPDGAGSLYALADGAETALNSLAQSLESTPNANGLAEHIREALRLLWRAREGVVELFASQK